MKREIKFRAWHGGLNQMFWFDLLWGSMHNNGTGWIGMLPIEQKERKRTTSFIQPEDRIPIDPAFCDIMQFTGLKDKNGVEIYEGDKVQYYQPYSRVWETHIVKWDNGLACFALFEQGNEYFKECDWIKIQKVEVIGNIYENPQTP